jgi:uncharacterized BrkB/YihY/UPF0761 family membrane protein
LTSEPASPPPLPSRPPRSLFVHWAVDSAVAFLALFVLGLILGVSIVIMAVIAVALGAAAAPSTRRAEMRQLAEREQRKANE